MPPATPIYCCVPIEFVQPWDHLDCIRAIGRLALGNAVIPSATFHLGNSEEDRSKWKELFPEVAAQVDATPRFEARPEHGMAVILDMPLRFWEEQIRLSRELALPLFALPVTPGMAEDQRDRLAELARGMVVSECAMGEATSLLAHGLTAQRLKQITDAAPAGAFTDAGDLPPFDDPEALDYARMHDWFVALHRPKVRRAKARAPLVSAIEATTQLRVAMEVGVDVPILELVPAEPLTGLASARGAAKAYGAPFWGVHTALGYYRAPTDAWTPRRLAIAHNLFYVAGASYFSEPNIAFRNWGSCSGFFSEPASPPLRAGERECRGFDDPICAGGRDVLAEHYRFTRFHERPPRGPRVPIGFVLGHLDGWVGGHQQSHVWCVEHPAFAAGAAEATWRHFGRMYEAESWYTPPRKYYWQADPSKPLRHGTPPAGQADIVPAEAPLDVLRTYRCLVFLGWNTMTAELYEKLGAYVEGGGRLFLSVPHLSTRTRSDRPIELIRGGDVSDLFGVRVTGPGAEIEEVLWTADSEHAAYAAPVNTLYLEPARLAKVELQGARVLARPRGEDHPVLLEHRRGRGLAWLLATWDYPGERLDAFITDVLRTLAEGEQEEIALEGEGVDYALYDGEFPSGVSFTVVYLVNMSIYHQPQYPTLLVRGQRIPLRVAGGQMRIAWLVGDLLVSPMSRFVKVADAVQETQGGWRIRLVAEPGEHALQIATHGPAPSTISVNGRANRPNRGLEGEVTVHASLEQENQLTVSAAGG